jgi:hypothetical protein
MLSFILLYLLIYLSFIHMFCWLFQKIINVDGGELCRHLASTTTCQQSLITFPKGKHQSPYACEEPKENYNRADTFHNIYLCRIQLMLRQFQFTSLRRTTVSQSSQSQLQTITMDIVFKSIIQ